MRTFGKATDLIVTSYFGFLDAFRIRLISLASQKFISDIANDALQYCKMKGTASGSSRSKTKVGGFVADFVCESFLLMRISTGILCETLNRNSSFIFGGFSSVNNEIFLMSSK